MFDKKGNLKNFKQLKLWPVDEVLHEKYHFVTEDAGDVGVADFVTPCLESQSESERILYSPHCL